MCSVWLLISGILYVATKTSSKITKSPDTNRFRTPYPADVSFIQTELGIWHLDKQKYIKVRVYKGRITIDIREYYASTTPGKENKLMPGKRGISLNQYEWEKLGEAERYISGTIFNYTYLGDSVE